MSTEVKPETPTSGSEPSATSPSPVPTGGTSPTPSPEPFRYGESAPAWAKGKTAEEVLGIASQMEGALRGFVQNGQPVQQPTYQQPTAPYTAYPVPQPTTPAYDQEAYLQRRDVEAFAPRLIQEATAPQFTALYESVAQSNLETTKRNYAPIFDKYGPEVYSYLAKVPVQQRTVDNLKTIVDIVRGNHVEELASERASRLVADMGAELRSTGSPMPPGAPSQPQLTLKSDTIPQDWRERAATAGLTESAVDEFCRANDMTREQFFGQFGTTAITEVTRRG